MSESGHIYNSPFPSNSPLHQHHQLNYGDTTVSGSLLHTSQPSQESQSLEPLNHRLTTAFESQRTHLSGNTSLSEVGASSPRLPPYNQSLYNKDHAYHEGLDLSSGATRDAEMTWFPHIDDAFEQRLDEDNLQQQAHLLWNESTHNALSYFGSQFDTEASYYHKDAEKQDSFACTSPANNFINNNDSYLIDGEVLNFSGATAPVADISHLDRTQRSLRQNQIPRGAASQRGRPSNSSPMLHYALPGIVVSDYTSPVGSDLFAPLQADPVMPANLMQQAYNISNTLNSRWLSRLEFRPDLHEYCSTFPPQWLFDAGVRTLRNCYNGAFPCTFSEIFALMHAAFAFSRVPANVDGSYNWEALSQDVYRWRYIIQDAAEVEVFVGVWQSTWSLQASMEILVLENGFLNAVLYINSPFNSINTDTNQKSITPEISVDPDDQLFLNQYPKHTEKLLMGGMVVKACSKFLDAFKHATIIQRNTRWLVKSPCTDQAYLINSVIKPLKDCRVADILPQHIASTIKKLDDGVLHNLRELEVTLTSSSEWSRIPHQDHKQYLDHVATQCNLAAQEPESSWRNEYYVDELNQVIELFACHTQQRGDALDSSVPAQAMGEPPTHVPQELVDGHLGLIIPDSGGRRATAAVPPIPPVGFGASPNYNHPSVGWPNVSLAHLQDSRTVDPTSCSVTSSDFQSDGSPSSNQAISEPSSPTASSVTTCSSCSKSYQGTPSIQRRNLRRHLFEKHSLDPRLQCLVPGCRINFPPGRHDNRNRHLEQQHGWQFPPTPRTVHKRRAT